MKRLPWGGRGLASIVLAVGVSLTSVQVANATTVVRKANLIPVTYGISSQTLAVLPQYLALKEGFYRKHGLNVNLENITAGGPATIAAVVSGSVPFAVTSVFQMWNYIEQGAPLLGIAQEIQGIQYQICLQPNVAAARGITPKTSPAEMLQDLHGLSIGGLSAGNPANLILNGLYKAYGVANNITEVQNQSSANDAILQAGQVNGLLASPPQCQIAEQQGFGKVVWQLASIKQFAISCYGLTFTTSSYAKKHPKIVSALIGALNDAQKWMVHHKRFVEQYAISQFQAPASTVADTIASEGYAPTTQIPAIAVRNAQDLANSFNLTTSHISNAVEQIVYTNRYYKYS